MSAALDYREPYRLSAGVLALAVHLLFFSLLYFGYRWQAQQPEVFAVDMWASLPEPEVVPEAAPAPPLAAEAAIPPKTAPESPPAKADIELRGKKDRKAEAKEKLANKGEEKKRAAAARAKREKEEKRLLDAYAVQRAQRLQEEKVRAEEAATMTQVIRFRDKIRDKIRRNIVMPPDVPEGATAEFRATLLPDGSVLEVELLKSSGNTAYDNAAERAIYKAQPLPLPPDEGLKKMFRELRLTVRP